MNFFQPIKVHASHPEEIEISRIEMTETGLFFYQGQQLVLYIKDSGKKIEMLEYCAEQAHKFHLTNCTTIGNTLHNRRILQRFIATARDDGFFYVNGLTEEGETREYLIKLNVCRSCLIKLNYRKYCESDKRTQNTLVETFSIQDFFAYCDAFFTKLPQLEISTSQDIEIEVNVVLVRFYFMQILLRQVCEYFFSQWIKFK